MLEYAIREVGNGSEINRAKPHGRRLPVTIADWQLVGALLPGDSAAENMKRGTDSLKFELGDWRGYLPGIGMVVISTLLGRLLSQVFSPENIMMLYLLCVTITAVFWRLGPSILVSVLSVLAFDFFFIPPFLTFAVDDTQYILTFLVFLFVGIVISYFTARIRQQTEAARLRERETSTLFTLSGI